MPEILTFIVPCAGYHADHVNRAVESIRQQTIPCEYIVVEDDQSRGPGWARNRGLAKAESNFCSFLDADDTVEPEFAETCLDVWSTVRQANRYVYTNWYIDSLIRQAPSPCDLWTQPFKGQSQTGISFHLVTTFLPTQYARAIGGFDETMPANEDADFAVRLKLAGYCGIHLNQPLVHYNRGGQRSNQGVISGETELYARDYFPSRYGQYERLLTMGCCGGSADLPKSPQGEKQDGDVLAVALWAGNRTERGLDTGRLYPRMSYPKEAWVAPSDIAKAPHMWRKVMGGGSGDNVVIQARQQVASGGPNITDWTRGADAVFGGGQRPPAVSQEAHRHYAPLTNDGTPAETIKKARKQVKRP